MIAHNFNPKNGIGKTLEHHQNVLNHQLLKMDILPTHQNSLVDAIK